MQDWYFSLHPFSDVLKFDGVFSLKMHNRSIASIRISEKMVSTPPGQRLRTTRSPHQVIPLLLAATRLLIKGQAETFLNSGPIISLRN